MLNSTSGLPLTGRPGPAIPDETAIYLTALVYAAVLTGLMLAGLWQDWGSYGGGNHWAWFGTPLDRLIQTLGLPGLMALSLPAAVVAVVALLRSHYLWAVCLVVACVALACVTYVFALTALD